MVTVLKPRRYAQIKSMLNTSDGIEIAFCGSCPSLQGLGEEKLKSFIRKLKKDGFKIADGINTISLGCQYEKVKRQQSNLKDNSILVWGCDSYVYNLKKLFPKRNVVPAMQTMGLGVSDGEKVQLIMKYGKLCF